MKICSKPLVKEMQIKMTVRYHFASTRMTKIKKTDMGAWVIQWVSIYLWLKS